MSSLNKTIEDTIGISSETMVIILGILLFYFNYLSTEKFLITNIIITSFVLAIFDLFLKKILLFNVSNDYYKFVINNVITIIIIDLLSNVITNGLYNNDKLCIITYFNLAFACFFYETIVHKLFNYNSLCNDRLRTITKTVMRLATIHILSNFLNGKSFDGKWFDFSFGQIFNFSFFTTVFAEY